MTFTSAVKTLFLVLVVCLVQAACQTACAHGLNSGQSVLEFNDKQLLFSLAVPVPALAAYDDNRDGRLDDLELERHRLALATHFVRSIKVGDGAHTVQWKSVSIAPVEHLESSDAVAGIRFTARADLLFPLADAPQVHQTLWGAGYTANRMAAIELHDQSVVRREVRWLTEQKPQVRFFPSTLTLVEEFVGMGVEHVLLGWDHLLFLLTVLLARCSIKRWVTLLLGFSVAHALTFSLACLGYIELPAVLIESSIAASICAAAFLSLRGRQPEMRIELPLIMAVGLIHGLGFAGGLTQAPISTSGMAWAIIGFNLGIEIGQFAFALLLALMIRLLSQAHFYPVQRMTTFLAGIFGLSALGLRILQI